MRIASLQQCKDFLKGGADVTGEKEKAFKFIIEGVSAAIEREIYGNTGFSLKQASSDGIASPVERYGNEHYGRHLRNKIRLKRFPVSSVSQVNDDGGVMSADDYQIDAQTGILFRLVGAFANKPLAVQVIYTAGYAEVSPTVDKDLRLNTPDDLRLACMQQAAFEFGLREPGAGSYGATSVSRPDGSVAIEISEWIAPVRRILKHYRGRGPLG